MSLNLEDLRIIVRKSWLNTDGSVDGESVVIGRSVSEAEIIGLAVQLLKAREGVEIVEAWAVDGYNKDWGVLTGEGTFLVVPLSILGDEK